MILKDLVNKFTWEDIEETFFSYYPEEKVNIDGYKIFFDNIKKLDKEENFSFSREMRICISKEKNQKGEIWYDLSGKNGRTYREEEGMREFASEESLDEEIPYAIEFHSWEDWLAMEIDFETRTDLCDKDILCHCVYDMTFLGFSEEERKNEIERISLDFAEEEGLADSENIADFFSEEEDIF